MLRARSEQFKLDRLERDALEGRQPLARLHGIARTHVDRHHPAADPSGRERMPIPAWNQPGVGQGAIGERSRGDLRSRHPQGLLGDATQRDRAGRDIHQHPLGRQRLVSLVGHGDLAAKDEHAGEQQSPPAAAPQPGRHLATHRRFTA